MDRDKHQNFNRPINLLAIICLSLLVITNCSCGNSAAKKPEVSITTEPTSITAGDVTISVNVNNFEIVNEEVNRAVSGQGHIVYYMDVPVPTYYYHSAISKAGTYVTAYETSYTWSNVTPGEHVFSVQLVNEDDTPLAAPVTDSITVEVGPPTGKPGIEIIYPLSRSALPPGNIALALKVDNFIISHADRGVINRAGEGHLIYYIDEEPPTEPGIPAITDTSIVSADTSCLWKNVKEGQHTLAVQLVNNNDTPLDSPVVTTISIDVVP